MPVSEPFKLPPDMVHGKITGLCCARASLIELDLKGPSAATIAAKLVQHVDEFEP